MSRRAAPRPPASASDRVPFRRKALAWVFVLMLFASALTALALAFSGGR